MINIKYLLKCTLVFYYKKVIFFWLKICLFIFRAFFHHHQGFVKQWSLHFAILSTVSFKLFGKKMQHRIPRSVFFLCGCVYIYMSMFVGSGCDCSIWADDIPYKAKNVRHSFKLFMTWSKLKCLVWNFPQ